MAVTHPDTSGTYSAHAFTARGGRSHRAAVRVFAVITVIFGIAVTGKGVSAAGPGNNPHHHFGHNNTVTSPTSTATSDAQTATAAGTPKSDPNPGDVWVDNVGQPSGPGHEMDPHLACADIQLWGDKLGDASGSYTVDGWQPSGSQEQDYGARWSYNTARADVQKIGLINVATLLTTARNNGDAPVNKQGFHFKLQFSQDPQKHKTFWINCPAPARATPIPTANPAATPTPTPNGGVLGTQSTPTPTPGHVDGGVLATSTSTPSTGAQLLLIPGLALILFGAGVLGLTNQQREPRSVQRMLGLQSTLPKPRHWA